MTVPYPGHTWSFTQHAVGIGPAVLHELLRCAAVFEGTQGQGRAITDLMVERGILTANEREGKPDAWRDYQQILPELGLIYSTQIHPSIRLTDAGRMLLAGDIGFSELMGVQALRYQYPNGHKGTIQKRLRDALDAARVRNVPETLTELQASSGVLLRPGLLILRILLELNRAGLDVFISVSECQELLLPVKENSEWPRVIDQIIRARHSRRELGDTNRYARRNMQDWFKFLGKTDIFLLIRDKIFLTPYAIGRRDALANICEFYELPENFWIPGNFDNQNRLTWFEYFGDIPLEIQPVMRDSALDDGYVRENYIEGVGAEELGEFVQSGVQVPEMALRQIGEGGDYQRPLPRVGLRIGDAELLANIRRGHDLTRTKSALHDSIVDGLATVFRGQGAEVFEDPDSVDLLARWPDGAEGVFEVKTVTQRNLQGRLRAAVGQIEEYSYRRSKITGHVPDKVIVINAALKEDAWQVDFLTRHLGTGLLCKSMASCKGFAPDAAPSRRYWEDIHLELD